MILNNENPRLITYPRIGSTPRVTSLLAWTALFLLNVYCIIEFFFVDIVLKPKCLYS